MERVMPCRPTGLEAKPRRGPISVTQVELCRRPVGPIVPARPEAQISFLTMIFSPKFVLIKKPFNITKFKVKT
jgi:hypothetical protein